MVIGIDASRANVREKTGTEWYGWHLIRLLAPRLADHDIRLYSREPLEPALSNLGPRVTSHVLRWPPGILWSHVRLTWEMIIHPPDVLFVPANTVPVIHPRRSYTTLHDVAFERFPELYRGRSVQRRLGFLRPFVHALVRLFTLGRYSASERDYHRWSSRHGVRTCRRVFTPSEFSKREIIETLQAPAEKIVITPLGVIQPEEFSAITDETCRAILADLTLTKPFALFVGRLESKKNIANMVAAYLEYRAHQAEPIDLVLAGSPGYGWEPVEKMIAASPMPSAIHVLPWQPMSTIRVLQKMARLCFFVTRYEGFGFPPLESLSAGVPVLASTSGSLPEVLGEAAMLTDVDDVVAMSQQFARLAHDEDLRRTLITRGLSWVRQYTWDRTADLTARELRA